MAGEWYHLLYNNVYGIRACALRLTNTYGPRMRVKDARQTFLGIWVRQLIEGKPIEVFGDGSSCATSTTWTTASTRCCWPATADAGDRQGLQPGQRRGHRTEGRWPS